MWRNGVMKSERWRSNFVSRGMIWDIETSSIPEVRSQTIISLFKVVDQPTQAINERADTYKPNSILKNEAMSENVE